MGATGCPTILASALSCLVFAMLLAVSLAVLFTVLFAMLFTVLFAVQVPERGPPGDEFDRRTVGVTLNGWDEPVPGACIRAGFSPDFPAAIVEQEVVVPAEEDPVGGQTYLRL